METSDLTSTIDSRSGPDIDEDAREAALKPIRAINFDTLLAWIQTLPELRLPRSARPRLLDVGCAHGWFLERAARDFDALGIEPDPEVARRTLARGQPVRQGFFPGALKEQEHFDVIIFNDVLEHIPDVVEALRRCEERLAPGGVVVVNAPDRRGIFYRIAGVLLRLGLAGPFERLWQKGLPSPHLYYFDSDSLAAAGERVGLHVVATRHLPTLTARGLYSRIRCSGDVPRWKAITLTIGILPMVPILRLMPADITVWVLARGRDQRIGTGGQHGD